MKTIKYLFVGALLMLFSAPVMAQDEDQATIDNITRVIKNNKGGNYEKAVKLLSDPEPDFGALAPLIEVLVSSQSLPLTATATMLLQICC